MTFLALLTKEMRLRMRHERTIWVIIVYVLFMGLLGWIYLNSTTNTYGNTNGQNLSDVGTNLYVVLSQIQLFLIIFITPSFTSTTVNGEKELQTYDMLLCSRLSAISLVLGKLGAGLLNSMLLIAASIPLFSLVFFFGGVSPQQIGAGLVIFIVTALWLGTLSLFCSTIFQRPAISTTVAYIFSLVWTTLPLVTSLLILLSGQGPQSVIQNQDKARLLFSWNPVFALINTYPQGNNIPPIFYFLGLSFGTTYGLNSGSTPVKIGDLALSEGTAYLLICLIGTLCLFLLCLWTIKPHNILRLRHGTVPLSDRENQHRLQHDKIVDGKEL